MLPSKCACPNTKFREPAYASKSHIASIFVVSEDYTCLKAIVKRHLISIGFFDCQTAIDGAVTIEEALNSSERAFSNEEKMSLPG